jgi:hypothetical protein
MTLSPPYSVAQHLSQYVDSGWERHKSLGNAAFEAGDYATAIAHYSDGISVATGPSRSTLGMLFSGLKAHNLCAKGRRDAEYRDQHIKLPASPNGYGAGMVPPWWLDAPITSQQFT